MKISFLLMSCLLTVAVQCQLPTVFILDAGRMAELKLKFAAGDKMILDYRDSLKKEADHFLGMKPVSVMDKQITPPSGDKHDYMSQAPYFWYDSSKPKGLPYLRRDGVRNPEINKITDHVTLDKMQESTRILSLAWYLLGDEKYAAKCASLIRTCFLDKATKMNPNLDYGQGIPGINTGRGIGIIETRSLMYIADAVGLLKASKSWTNSDQSALEKWYADYLKWLLNSKNGKEEHAAKNNHGTWYYAQAIDFALFSGDKTRAHELVLESKKRLDSQLTKEGKQPLELERTNALGYSTMNLDGWLTISKLAKFVSEDLWNYTTPKSVGIGDAMDWLLPFAIGQQKFEYQQINKYDKAELFPVLLKAGLDFKAEKYLHYLLQIPQEDKSWLTSMLYNIAPRSAMSDGIRVLTYNIHHANPPSKPDLIDIKAIAEVISKQQADIVALQEIDVYNTRSGSNVHEANEIAKLTGMKAYFAKGIDYGGGAYGVAILSKFPMEDTMHIPLPTDESTKGEHRTLGTAVITLPGGKKLLFACTHLDAQASPVNRLLQIKKITEYLSAQKLPVILAGDLNATADNEVIKILDSSFTRTCISNCGFTIPEKNPNKTIDYIAYKPAGSFAVLQHKVVQEDYASDHLPVLAVIKFPVAQVTVER